VSGMRRVSCGAARLLWGRRVGLLVSTFPIRSFSMSKQSTVVDHRDGPSRPLAPETASSARACFSS
jgi:hypothetical protein